MGLRATETLSGYQVMFFKNHRANSGMTTVELIVAMIIATLITVSFIAVLVHLFSSNSLATKRIVLAAQAQDAVDSIARDINYTTKFMKTTTLADADMASSPIGAWSYEGSGENSRQLILEANATTKSYQNPDNSLVFEKVTPDCASLAPFAVNNIVYYVKNDTLYRRTITPQGIDVCPEPIYQKKTCLDQAADPACKEKDIAVAPNISRFSVDYYQNSYDATPANVYDESSAPDALALVPSIRVTLTIASPDPKNIEPLTTTILLSKGGQQ